MSEWKKTWCSLCAVTCGLEMEVEDGKIINKSKKKAPSHTA